MGIVSVLVAVKTGGESNVKMNGVKDRPFVLSVMAAVSVNVTIRE